MACQGRQTALALQITLVRLRQAKRGSELLKHSDLFADKAATVLDHDSRVEPTSVPGHDPQTRECNTGPQTHDATGRELEVPGSRSGFLGPAEAGQEQG